MQFFVKRKSVSSMRFLVSITRTIPATSSLSSPGNMVSFCLGAGRLRAERVCCTSFHVISLHVTSYCKVLVLIIYQRCQSLRMVKHMRNVSALHGLRYSCEAAGDPQECGPVGRYEFLIIF